MKQCTRCKETLPLSSFNKDKRRKDGLTLHCKKCVKHYSDKRLQNTPKEVLAAQAAKWKKDNPEKVRATALKMIFKMSYEDYVRMYENQHGSCKICKTPLILYGNKDQADKVANVDHCHTTGKIRGLLCRRCNTAIGLLNDNATVLRLAAEYLDEHASA